MDIKISNTSEEPFSKQILPYWRKATILKWSNTGFIEWEGTSFITSLLWKLLTLWQYAQTWTVVLLFIWDVIKIVFSRRYWRGDCSVSPFYFLIPKKPFAGKSYSTTDRGTTSTKRNNAQDKQIYHSNYQVCIYHLFCILWNVCFVITSYWWKQSITKPSTSASFISVSLFYIHFERSLTVK